jgi:uncharacterized protein (DUF983 family)
VELRSVFGEMEWRERLDGFEADIWSKKYGFVVEVDGFPWHAGNENRDTLKNEHFRKHGLDTFRLRDYRLKAIGSNDVPFCSDASEKKTFHDALKLLVIKVINSRKFPKRVKCIADSYVNSDSFFDDASYREMLVYLKGPPPSKDLETLFPEIASEWSARNPMKPSQMYPYSSERVLFVCPHGHEYEQIINVRTGMGTNCPICSNRRVLQGYNDLESKCPLIANEWSGKNDISPSEVVWTSRKKVFWDCPKCGKEYMGVIRNRTQKQSGCASCSKKKSCAKRKLTKK